MTEFNNLNTENNENIKAEELKNSSAEGVPLQNQENFVNTENAPINQNINYNTFNQFAKPFDPVLYEEKNNIKTDARTIGAAFLVMYGVIFLFNLVVIIFGMILKASNSGDIANILWSSVSLQIQQIIFASVAFTIPFILIYRLSDIRIRDLMCFSIPKIKIAVPFFFFGIAFCSFANIVSSMAAAIFEKSNINYNVTKPENPTGFFGFMLALISTVIVPALVEEFACRGLMLGLLKKYGEGFAIIASSLLFGLMHGNFEQMPFAFLVGLVLGFITVKSGTIVIAMAVHAFNNFISIAFEYLLSSVPKNIQNIGYLIFLICCLLLGIIAIFILNGNDKGIYELKSSKMKTSDSKKFVWFFTSIPILIYTVLCLIESMQFFVF